MFVASYARYDPEFLKPAQTSRQRVLTLVPANPKRNALDRESWSESDASLKKTSLPRQPNSNQKRSLY